MNEPIARAEWWGHMQESKLIKRDESDRIARQTAEFLAAGGDITQVERGTSAYEFAPLVKPLATAGNQSSAHESNKSREANKAAQKAVARNARLNQQHTAIIHAVIDLMHRGVKTSLAEIRKLTGQPSDSLGRQMDVLILRGFITEGVRDYFVTDKGLEYIGDGK